MEFLRVSKWFLESRCGQYSVSRTPDSRGRNEYKAWHRLKQIGGPYTNSADAKQACADHCGEKGAA